MVNDEIAIQKRRSVLGAASFCTVGGVTVENSGVNIVQHCSTLFNIVIMWLPSGAKWSQVEPSGTKWSQVEPNGANVGNF